MHDICFRNVNIHFLLLSHTPWNQLMKNIHRQKSRPALFVILASGKKKTKKNINMH